MDCSAMIRRLSLAKDCRFEKLHHRLELTLPIQMLEPCGLRAGTAFEWCLAEDPDDRISQIFGGCRHQTGGVDRCRQALYDLWRRDARQPGGYGFQYLVLQTPRDLQRRGRHCRTPEIWADVVPRTRDHDRRIHRKISDAFAGTHADQRERRIRALSPHQRPDGLREPDRAELIGLVAEHSAENNARAWLRRVWISKRLQVDA